MKNTEVSRRPEGYEKPMVKRHAVVMTMAPAGCKMGHGLFPFTTKTIAEGTRPAISPSEFSYRRV
ncbi:MAG: hypothetical protein KJ626_04395 [Verrucomicrobia bacterium]|nr:hypothetical protein [Verrucomicrobiota bacterium]